jgi:RNA-binding protein YlmH
MTHAHTLAHYSTSDTAFVKQVLAFKSAVFQTGRPKVTDFLTLHEQQIVEEVIGHDLTLCFYGGFENSERQRAIISRYDVADVTPHIVVLKLTYHNKFTQLRHQDVLGAILGLGLERKVIGDIVVQDEAIFVALTQSIVPYVQAELKQVGRASVTVSLHADEVIKEEENFKEKTIYVNSLRLDSLISHILPCNRVKAKALITKELVQVNGARQTQCKAGYGVHDIISVKKFGRIYIDNIFKTKRERFKVEVRIT